MAAQSSSLRAQGRPAARATISQLGWLAGAWTRSDGGATTEERWIPAAGGAMLAVVRTVKGGRMAAFEFLRIVERDGTLVFIAQPNGRPPTEFALTDIGRTRVTFENPLHDFPKVIRYEQQADGTLRARVEGGTNATVITYRPMR
jgi:hypothetical protein